LKNKSVCLHLHFDLPPGESPWLEEPEADSAALPYRDAAEKRFHECWGPNTAAPLPSREGRFLGLRDNYPRLSFDFSPSLLDWLQRRQPAAYGAILDADRSVRDRDGGHGAALAAPHPALILPLASLADKRAAVRWGLRDFEERFRRPAEGIWLPENAADEETMEVLAECGIRFTLLAAPQAARVRPTGSESDSGWLEVAPETLTLTRPYRWRSKEKRGACVDVFFYRADISAERMLQDMPSLAASQEDLRARAAEAGQRLANKLVDSLTANDARELAHAVLDGAWFGGWRPYGEQALAFALEALDTEPPAGLISYGRFLDLVPPPQEVALQRLSSRSCPHGVGRWSTDCGCGEQKAPWRKPLRAALDWLAAELDQRFEQLGGDIFRSCQEAREGYGAMVFDPRPESSDTFLEAQTLRHPTPHEARTAMRLCEMQRRRLLMLEHWTWQSRDVAEGGAVHGLAEAARALELLETAAPAGPSTEALRQGFLSRLASCPSEGTAYPNAAEVFRRAVLPWGVSLEHAAAHFAAADHLFHSASLDEAFLIRPGIPFRALERVLTPLCRRTTADRRRTCTVSVTHIAVRRRRSYESLTTLAAVLHRGGTDLEVWTGDPGPGCAAALDEAFLRGGEEAFRKDADARLGSSRFAMDALLPAARREAAAALLSRSKSGLRDLRRRWSRIVVKLGRSGSTESAERAAELLRESQEAGIPPEALPGTWILRDHISRTAASLGEGRGARRAGELILLLRTASDTGLRLDLWELRASAWKALNSPAKGTLEPETADALRDLLGLPETPEPVLEERW